MYRKENGYGLLIEKQKNLTFKHYIHKSKDGHYKLKRRKHERVVFKNGEFNIEEENDPVFRRLNIVNCFVKARWRWTLIYCILTYMIAWLLFSCIWWLILYLHGDFEELHMPQRINSTNWVPCVKAIYGFTSTFLFSIEIQTTIGYGTRIITLECPEAIFTMCIQGILGTIMQSFLVGLVFAKLTRPKSRTQTLLFTNHALISQRDHSLCLIFRVGDVRKSRIIAVSIHAYLIRFHSRCKELANKEQVKLDLMVDTCEDIVFTWPVSVVHKINVNSPLYTLSAAEMLTSKMEIVVVLEGTIESTGQPVQAVSSYTSKEIMWGHRFVEMVSYRHDRQGYEVDYSKFNETIQVDTPLCSAEILSGFEETIRHLENDTTPICYYN